MTLYINGKDFDSDGNVTLVLSAQRHHGNGSYIRIECAEDHTLYPVGGTVTLVPA